MSNLSFRAFKTALMSAFFLLSTAGLAAPVEIMSYNVQNLFDAEHDVENGVDKQDYTFTPTGTPGKAEYCEKIRNKKYKKECYVDWTPERVEEKIRQIVKAVKAGRDKLPDILGLIEVENEAVVKQLAVALGYPESNVFVTQSPDKRGVDVAILYKRQSRNFKFVEAKEYVIQGSVEVPMERPTRNILEAQFRLFGEPVVIYVAHWPSQGAPAKIRKQVAEEYDALITERKSENPDNHIVLMGDFNVIDSDFPHPLKGVTLAKDNPNRLFDVQKSFFRSGAVFKKDKYAVPAGTFFYPPKFQWNVLDRIFVSGNLEAGYKEACRSGLYVDAKTYKVHNPKILREDYTYKADEWKDSYYLGSKVMGIPREYHVVKKKGLRNVGFSDHFAISVTFDVTDNEPNEENCEGRDKYE